MKAHSLFSKLVCGILFAAPLLCRAGQVEGVPKATDFPRDIDVSFQESFFLPQDAAFLKTIKAAWMKKCAETPAAENCMLQERDVFSQTPTPDHVLLFRGEPKWALIGLSPLDAFALRHPRFCGGVCTDENLLAGFQRALAVMPPEAQQALCAHAMTDLVFHVDLDKWVLNNVRRSCHGDPFFHVGIEHISGMSRLKIQNGRDFADFDPFVSLSQDPNIAINFAQFNVDKTGRLVILSVDPKRLPQILDVPEEGAKSKPAALGSYYRFSKSLQIFSFEREVDAFLRIPKVDIKMIIAPAP